MSKAKFIDKVGHEITMQRLKYTISDSFACDDAGIIRRGIKIDIQSWAKREEVKNYKAWSNKGGEVIQRNTIGKITFMDDDNEIYMTINNVYLISIEEISETWREWGQVNIVFQNENMINGDNSVIKFTNGDKSVDIYNVQLNIQPSTLRKNHTTVPHWNGSFYQETGYEITRLQLSGTIPYDSCSFPENIVSVFENFNRVSVDGWCKNNQCDNIILIPYERKLSDFLPGVKNISLDKVFIENASLVWLIEKKIIQVNVSFVAPHQSIVREEEE